MKNKVLIGLGMSAFLAYACAAQSKPLVNSDVAAMATAGLSAGVIDAKIGATPCAFDTSTDGLLALKAGGVPPEVIATVAASHCAGVAVPVADPNDPASPHESGIYMLAKGASGQPAMTELERAAYQGMHTGGMFASAFTYGIKKVQVKAIIPGPKASIRVSDPDPEFYFYFGQAAAGLGQAFGQVSDPNQFALVKLEAKGKDRETLIAQGNAFGASSGTDQKAAVPFRSERVRDGIYRVSLDSPLKPGEYCFLSSMGAGGAATALEIFDFAVTGDK